MEENMVVNESVAVETPVADTSVEASVVNAIDILEEGSEEKQPLTEEQEPTVQPGETAPETKQEEPAPAPQADTAKYTQRDFDEAVRRKMAYATRDMQQRLEQDPYYKAGKQLAEQYGAADDVSPEVAIQRVMQEARERLVESIAKDPTMMARMLIQRSAQGLPEVPTPQTETPAAEKDKGSIAKAIAQDIEEGIKSGDIPKDFNIDDYCKLYPDFIQDCTEYGARAAVRTVHAIKAEQARQAEAMARVAQAKTLPKSTRPMYAEAEPGQIDYTKLSDAEFNRVKKRMHELYLEGKTVRI